jgi:hypothetical protein
MASPRKHNLPASTLSENLSPAAAELLLVTPEQAACILGLSVKWLAAAREGRKGIEGPPYIKLGPGRTAPIRYKLTSIQNWLAQFQEVVNSCGATPTLFRSFGEFERLSKPNDVWLFAINESGLAFEEFFRAVNAQVVTKKTKLRWISRGQAETGRVFTKKLAMTASMLKALAILGDGNLSIGLEVLERKM